MKTLYFDCNMGAAGDMLTAALFELMPDKDEFINEINSIGIEGVTINHEAMTKCGIKGTHITVKVNGVEEEEHHHHDHHDHDHHDHGHTHHHSSLHDIGHIVEHLNVSKKVKDDVISVYSLIAEAESYAHGLPVTEIHFHEVGTMDAIADVTAVCMLMEKLSPDRVVVSPIHVGSGQVKCAHGILPVPAPATAYILKEVPIYGGEIRSELCTPTGAALLKYFADDFGTMPIMKVKAVGYGMGKKDFEVANCVRAFLGDSQEESDSVLELECNLDDITAEEIGFAQEVLIQAGALEVFTTAVMMKKSRPGIMLTVLCARTDRDRILSLIFRHTTTLGVREKICKRYILDRRIEKISTEYGEIDLKISSGYGVTRKKFEYEDLAIIARSKGISIKEVRDRI